MKKTGKVFHIACLTILGFIFTSCKKDDHNLYGRWGVYTVIYKGEDISGIDFSKKFTSGHIMTIDRTQKFITLPVKSEEKEFGDFATYYENGNYFLKIYNATDPRFNGIYLITIIDLNPESEGISKKYEIELESQDLYILGRKDVVVRI
jgi:hypothetical protein